MNTIAIRPMPYKRIRLATRGAYNPPEYVEWREQAAWLLKADGLTIPNGPVSVFCGFAPDGIAIEISPQFAGTRPKGLTADLDNLTKAVLDTLEILSGTEADGRRKVWNDRAVTRLEAVFYEELP
jgi:Holliday junction resolvase RusA-like endonuclease